MGLKIIYDENKEWISSKDKVGYGWLRGWPCKNKKPCSKCLFVHTLDNFGNKIDGFLSTSNLCKNCMAVNRRIKFEETSTKTVISYNQNDKFVVYGKVGSNTWLNSWPHKDKKPCIICLDVKLLAEFNYDRAGYLLRSPCCTICKRLRAVEYAYGTGAKDLYNLIKLGAHCEACGLKLPLMGIDHCHKTSNIRGILCNNCNLALGLLKDDPKRIKGLLVYIEKAGR